MFKSIGNSLEYRFDAEKLLIEPWGNNALRVRSTKTASITDHAWALEFSKLNHSDHSQLDMQQNMASIINGNIKATIKKDGKLIISNVSGTVLLEEFTRNRRDVTDPNCSALEIQAREFKPIMGTENYHLTARFESLDPREKIYGMGQYQQPHLNRKGHDIELAHRNSQASVPFALSSRGYGFLWNNPGIGRAIFGMNVMTFEAYSTQTLDYWIIAGETPAEIVQGYAEVTGKVPIMPDYGLGFWQCKLRYQNQEELLQVAREYRKRALPLDVIVCDFFHWPMQGEWKFDPTFWPDPDAMIKELKDLDIELMVSIWPTVDKRSENYEEMLTKGLLIRTERGLRTVFDFEGDSVHFDATNPEAREYVWQKAKQNYWQKGVKIFWLDEAEPEYTVYDFEHYRYHLGSNVAIGNIFPVKYSQAFYEGMEASGQTNIVNLVRCAWAGSQRYGALVWSGDIASSWGSFKNQLAAGLSMGLCGIAWWTTDIGGFHGGDPNDEDFRELFVRWFQWGTFCPVMRLHGDREPKQEQQGTTGGAGCRSGAANEVWSYGPKVYEICKKYMAIREQLRNYTREQMKDAHIRGTPLIRPLFYDFPEDKEAWEIESQYMYGPTYLCCPVLSPGQSKMNVYLPHGQKWRQAFSNERESYTGGRLIEVTCQLDTMPVFERL